MWRFLAGSWVVLRLTNHSCKGNPKTPTLHFSFKGREKKLPYLYSDSNWDPTNTTSPCFRYTIKAKRFLKDPINFQPLYWNLLISSAQELKDIQGRFYIAKNCSFSIKAFKSYLLDLNQHLLGPPKQITNYYKIAYKWAYSTLFTGQPRLRHSLLKGYSNRESNPTWCFSRTLSKIAVSVEWTLNIYKRIW